MKKKEGENLILISLNPWNGAGKKGGRSDVGWMSHQQFMMRSDYTGGLDYKDWVGILIFGCSQRNADLTGNHCWGKIPIGLSI